MKFHNGNVVTAEDVKYSLERVSGLLDGTLYAYTDGAAVHIPGLSGSAFALRTGFRAALGLLAVPGSNRQKYLLFPCKSGNILMLTLPIPRRRCRQMAKCDICQKGVTFGIKVSHSHHRSNSLRTACKQYMKKQKACCHEWQQASSV